MHSLIRTMLFTIPICSFSTPLLAQSPELERACAGIAAQFQMVPSVKIGVAQSFPELDPPGARLTYSIEPDAKPDEIDDQIECQFKTAAPPYELIKFCLDRTCYSTAGDDPEMRRRFEEIRILVERAQLNAD